MRHYEFTQRTECVEDDDGQDGEQPERPLDGLLQTPDEGHRVPAEGFWVCVCIGNCVVKCVGLYISSLNASRVIYIALYARRFVPMIVGINGCIGAEGRGSSVGPAVVSDDSGRESRHDSPYIPHGLRGGGREGVRRRTIRGFVMSPLFGSAYRCSRDYP